MTEIGTMSCCAKGPYRYYTSPTPTCCCYCGVCSVELRVFLAKFISFYGRCRVNYETEHVMRFYRTPAYFNGALLPNVG